MKLQPPYSIGQDEDAFWVQDGAGLRFGYCFIQRASQVGADPTRPDRVTALKTVRRIKKMAQAEDDVS